MRKILLAAIAGAAMASLSFESALSATCSGTLSTSCVVEDSDGDSVGHGGSNPAVDLRGNNFLQISESFKGTYSNTAFQTIGNFNVASGIGNTATAVTVTAKNLVSYFSELFLSFNGGPAQDIHNGGNFFFTLAGGVLNSFTIVGKVSTETSLAPSEYTVTLNAVPLPPALLLFGTALAGMGLLRRKRVA